jgi:hypothetical protein
MTRIREEVADISRARFLSNDLGINLSKAIQNKLTLNEDKYPVEKYKGVFELHS